VTRQTRTTLTALGFLLPNFLGFAVFTLGPVLFSFLAAFTNWTLVKTVPLQWVGLDNFRELLTSHQFWQYFINTVYFMLGMPISIFGSLFLAILISQKVTGRTVYRTLFYLPSFTAGVALFILWKKLYNPEFGPINLVLEYVAHSVGWTGFDAPNWLSSTQNLLGLAEEKIELVRRQFGLGARDAIIIMGAWVTIGGPNMLLYVAGISNIPQDLYEASDIDGANAWQRFRHVTWPQLAPTTFFIVIMSFIGGLQGGFEQARVMTLGGPAGTTTTLAYYIYNKAFMEFQIGYASAIAWALFIMIFAVTLTQWRFGSRYVNN
jgi:multiple sugar transport system permease protein